MVHSARFALFLVSLVCSFGAEAGLRIRFGLTDTGNTVWDGSISVAPGAIERIDGWRFQEGDKIVNGSSWQASTRPLTVRRSNNPKKKKQAGGMMADNGVFVVLRDVTEQSVVQVKTKKGDFSFRLAEAGYGNVLEKLGGAVDIERVAASRQVTQQRSDDDYPALAVAKDGTAYTAWISFTPGIDRDERARAWQERPADLSHLNKPVGGDQLWLRVQKGGTWTAPIAITSGGGDLYKCAVTLDGDSRAWVVWSENKSFPKTALANFDIWACAVTDGKPGTPVRISEHAGNDVNPVAATDAAGRVWIAWQGARDNVFRILERHQAADGKWSPERRVSHHAGNCWMPAIATSASGRIAIAWDTYDKGDYDVWLREFTRDGSAGEPRPVANSPLYEARATAAYDRDSRLWVAWEYSGPTWGKDWGALERNSGIGLYRDRQIGLLVLADGKWFEPAGALADALPGNRVRRGPRNLPVRRPEDDAGRKAGQEAEAAPASTYNNIARMATDADGRIWLFARSREGTFHTPLGFVWQDYAAYYDGNRWVGPVILPHSDNLLYNLPAVAAHPAGGLVVAHSSDHRQSRHLARARGANDSLGSASDPYDNDIFVSRLEFPRAAAKLALVPAKKPPGAPAAPSADTLRERQDVARMRAYRINYDGKQLRLLRGEFHRHTEISGDGGGDGPLEDMWRYGMDVAAMDWLGNGDHDNGNGREYTWWLTQKTTDAFRVPGSFDPPFSYERSVRYPEGHRNVVFAQRGVRTLPRLPISSPDKFEPAPDTLMLYDYLRLFNGVCASHTSATDTNWQNGAWVCTQTALVPADALPSD